MPTVFTEGQKEAAKWEQFERDCPRGLQPGNPYKFRPYPWMLYKAKNPPGFPGAGKWAVAVQDPEFYGYRDQNEWQRACQSAQNFTNSCRLTVNDDVEHKRQRDEGWRDTQKEALEFAEALQKLVGDEAAAANWRDRNMSEKALAEKTAAEEAHFGHLPSIPEKPRKRRGRPPKVKTETTEPAA